MIVAIGTDDTLASPGSQMNYYQALLDKMGRAGVDSFERLFVIPQVGHGLRGNNYSIDGDGRSIPAAAIPSTWDRVSLLVNWVEKGVAPGKSETVTAGERSLPLCSFPTYPKYVSGPTNAAGSYSCQ
jgi:feruloyl esterase